MTANRVERFAEYAPGDRSANTGAIRVTMNAAIVFAIVWLIEYLTGGDIDTDNPLVVLIAAFAVGFGYRFSRFLSAKYPSLGWVLFGIGTAPNYAHDSE